jgi:hypothetical protein
MRILDRMWRRRWREFQPEDESPVGESSEGEPRVGDWEAVADSRQLFVRTALRLAAAFALIFGGVFFAFWWSGSAIRFGTARAANRATPTWRVSGAVRNAATRQPVPWALVEDDPSGRPPFFRTDADHAGVYELLTFAEPHRIRVSSPGFQTRVLDVGRPWFVWMPEGREKVNIDIRPLY